MKMEENRLDNTQKKEILRRLEEGSLKMVAGGKSCSGHTWQKVEGHLYYCPKCGTCQTLNLGK